MKSNFQLLLRYSLGLLLLLSAVCLVYGDQMLQAIAIWQGDVIQIEPWIGDFGTGEQRTEKRIQFVVVNHGETTVRILGGTTNCRCAATLDLLVV